LLPVKGTDNVIARFALKVLGFNLKTQFGGIAAKVAAVGVGRAQLLPSPIRQRLTGFHHEE
jgi:hypothetical protein